MRLRHTMLSVLLGVTVINPVVAEGPRQFLPLSAWVTVDRSGQPTRVEWEQPALPAVRAALEDTIRGLRLASSGVEAGSHRTHLSGRVELEPQGNEFLPRLSDLRVGPKVSRVLPPRYPSDALRRRLGGRVLAIFRVDEQGQARDIRVDTAGEGEQFESAVRTALKAWRFEPEQHDGEPVSSELCVPFRFCLVSRSPHAKASAAEEALQCPVAMARLWMPNQAAAWDEIAVAASRGRRSTALCGDN
jgi:TonB family protein